MATDIRALRFGQRVRQLRQGAGLSQERLARRLELSRETIRRMEAGINWPSMSTFMRLADTLGVEPAQLLQPGEAASPIQASTTLPVPGQRLQRGRVTAYDRAVSSWFNRPDTSSASTAEAS